MVEDLGAHSLDLEIDAFADRVSALRIARNCAPEDALATLDAALVELERAERELRLRGQEPGGPAVSSAEPEDERHLVHGAFHELPVAACLVDHTGVIRRINRVAAEVLVTAPTYATGRPFSAFIELPARAAFASQLAGVVSSRQAAYFHSRLTSGNGSTDVRLGMSRIDVPGDVNPLVSVVVVSPAAANSSQSDTFASDTEEEVIVTAARRLDIMARMTRLLLDEESLSEPVALQRAARLLASEFADWAVIDVVRDGEVQRAVVAGSDEHDQAQGTRLLEETDPGLGELPREVLESGNPVVHPIVDENTTFGVDSSGTPLLTALRAGSLLCVPLRHQQESLGAVTLLRRSDRQQYELSDLGLLEEIADHLALALRTERRYQRRSDAADALQASLLPRSLPAIAGIELGVAYHAATEGVEVGGDFYDVFEGERGWGLVLGDVCGKGEDAAAVTAMVRHGVRLLGLWCTNPAEILGHINHAMVLREETDRFVTAIAAHIREQQNGAHVRLASAGHPRAAVLRADGAVHFTSGGGLPLGVFRDSTVTTENIYLFPRDTLLLYSDGVTEARRQDGTLYGDERLADALARAQGLTAQALVKAVEADMYEHSGGRSHDDIALLAVRVAA